MKDKYFFYVCIALILYIISNNSFLNIANNFNALYYLPLIGNVIYKLFTKSFLSMKKGFWLCFIIIVSFPLETDLLSIIYSVVWSFSFISIGYLIGILLPLMYEFVSTTDIIENKNVLNPKFILTFTSYILFVIILTVILYIVMFIKLLCFDSYPLFLLVLINKNYYFANNIIIDHLYQSVELPLIIFALIIFLVLIIINIVFYKFSKRGVSFGEGGIFIIYSISLYCNVTNNIEKSLHFIEFNIIDDYWPYITDYILKLDFTYLPLFIIGSVIALLTGRILVLLLKKVNYSH